MNETKIGQILLQQRLISPEQLKDALEKQQTFSPPQLLGELLVRLDYVKEEDLQHVLDTHKKRRSFTTVLLARNSLSKEDLEIALEMSRSEQLPLAPILCCN